jgi:hypothetical protein
MALLDDLITELETAPMAESMTTGATVMAVIAEAVLKNMGFPVSTKATVRFLIEEETAVHIVWPDEEVEDDESWRLT